jgi:UDP-3-O-[3-hydroxymyristoyl] N-acetylglucosamine deacetylase
LDIDTICDTTLAVTICVNGRKISTIEHLLSALNGLGIDNLFIYVNGVELPALDGSSWIYIQKILEVGMDVSNVPRKCYIIKEPLIELEQDKHILILPSDKLKINYTIEFGKKVLDKQVAYFEIEPLTYIKEIASARTFGIMEDVDKMYSMGLAKGGSLDNAVVISDENVFNRNLRFEDEFVRHKILDLIGDLYIGGYSIKGYVIAHKSGHSLDLKLLKKIISTCKLVEDTSTDIIPSPKDLL